MTETAPHRAAINTPLDVTSPTRFGAAAFFSRRVVARVLRHYDEHQQRRHTVTLDAVDAVDDAVLSIRDDLGALRAAVHGLQGNQEEILRQIDELRMWTDVANRAADVVNSETGLQRGRVKELSLALEGQHTLFTTVEERVRENERVVNRVVNELHEPPYISDKDALVQPGPDGRPRMGYTSSMGPDGSASTGYADFEDLFRGTENFITQRQRVYVDLLRDHAPVLDFGCGRGEMLRILAEGGIAARGVDTDETMLARCRCHGLVVDAADGLTALADCAPASLGAVVALQVVEHLPPESLPELFTLARRALRPGGILLCETVNPHSPAALRTFWLDLTHRHPLYPEALLLSARAAGYPDAHILFPYGSGELGEDLARAGEYTLVASTTVTN